MEIISNIALITINATLIIQILSFLIFLFILNQIMIRPLNRVMIERQTYLDGLKQDILASQKKMEELTTRLNEREMEARADAHAHKNELEDAGARKASEIYAAARKEIEMLKKTAEKEIEQQVVEARTYIREESELISTVIMESVLNRRLSS